MRLDYFIANATGLSRKDARQAVRQGSIRINGQPCRKSSTHVETLDDITLDGATLTLPGERYLMLFKPKGVISATTDSQQPTALDLLPAAVRKRLHIVGRLDRDTTGLLLLTTDGQWSHRITSPRAGCDKAYRVSLAESIGKDAIDQLESGVRLKDEPTPTRPARVTVVDQTTIELTISEGRYHQVKRMIAAVGNHVVALHRSRIGDIALDESLSPGEFRELTSAEINSVG